MVFAGACSGADSNDREKKETSKKASGASAKKSGPSKKKSSRRASKSAAGKVPGSNAKRKAACEGIRPLVEEIAPKYGLEIELVLGVIKVESGFNPKIKSRVGATGLMQLMPRTAKHMKCGSDLTDPETNIECGCRVLQRYLEIYEGHLVYGLSAYNCGPGNTNPSRKEDKLPFNFAYVEKVLRWRNYFVRYGCN